MVACVDGKGPPPDELRIAWDCQRWDALPDAGGYMDQDYQLMSRMTALSNVYNALSRMYALGQNIHQLSDGERRVLRVLVDEKLIFS